MRVRNKENVFLLTATVKHLLHVCHAETDYKEGNVTGDMKQRETKDTGHLILQKKNINMRQRKSIQETKMLNSFS